MLFCSPANRQLIANTLNRSNEIYKSRINQAIDYVNNNLNRSISLEELAAVAFFSPFHFHRIFVAVTGETVNNFTNRIRNEKAARLLKFSKKSISEISIECGFSSPSTLSRQFKQYFEISPAEYRKGGEIEISKIRKEWYPDNKYPCNLTEEEMVDRFPVEIRQFPERRIAYIRVVDAFREGEVCITIPENFQPGSENLVQTTTLPACKYAVTTVSGDFNLVVAATNYLFDNWLINSSYESEHLHALEVFLDKENVCNWNYFDVELCIPVKALQK